jgi:hypothetical protein
MSNQYISDRKPHLAAIGLAVCKINHDQRNIPDSVGDAEAAVDKPMVTAAGKIAFRARAAEVRDAAGGAAPAPKRHRPEPWYPATAETAGAEAEGRVRTGDRDILACFIRLDRQGKQHRRRDCDP